MDYTLFASDQSLHTSISPLSIPYSRQNPALIGLNPPPDVISNRCGELFTPEVQADHLNCVMESQTPYPPSPERSLITPNIITGGDVEFQPMPYREVATPIPIITPRVVPSPITYPVDQQLPSPVNFAPTDLWDLVKNSFGQVYDSSMDGSAPVLLAPDLPAPGIFTRPENSLNEGSYAPTTRTLGPEVATNAGGVGTMHDFLIGSKAEAAGPVDPTVQQLPSPVNFVPVDLWDLIKNSPEAKNASTTRMISEPTTRTLGPEVATNAGGVGTMHDFLIGSKAEAAGPVDPTVQQPSTSWLPLIMIAIAVFK